MSPSRGYPKMAPIVPSLPVPHEIRRVEDAVRQFGDAIWINDWEPFDDFELDTASLLLSDDLAVDRHRRRRASATAAAPATNSGGTDATGRGIVARRTSSGGVGGGVCSDAEELVEELRRHIRRLAWGWQVLVSSVALLDVTSWMLQPVWTGHSKCCQPTTKKRKRQLMGSSTAVVDVPMKGYCATPFCLPYSGLVVWPAEDQRSYPKRMRRSPWGWEAWGGRNSSHRGKGPTSSTPLYPTYPMKECCEIVYRGRNFTSFLFSSIWFLNGIVRSYALSARKGRRLRYKRKRQKQRRRTSNQQLRRGSSSAIMFQKNKARNHRRDHDGKATARKTTRTTTQESIVDRLACTFVFVVVLFLNWCLLPINFWRTLIQSLSNCSFTRDPMASPPYSYWYERILQHTTNIHIHAERHMVHHENRIKRAILWMALRHPLTFLARYRTFQWLSKVGPYVGLVVGHFDRFRVTTRELGDRYRQESEARRALATINLLFRQMSGAAESEEQGAARKIQTAYRSWKLGRPQGESKDWMGMPDRQQRLVRREFENVVEEVKEMNDIGTTTLLAREEEKEGEDWMFLDNPRDGLGEGKDETSMVTGVLTTPLPTNDDTNVTGNHRKKRLSLRQRRSLRGSIREHLVQYVESLDADGTGGGSGADMKRNESNTSFYTAAADADTDDGNCGCAGAGRRHSFRDAANSVVILNYLFSHMDPEEQVEAAKEADLHYVAERARKKLLEGIPDSSAGSTALVVHGANANVDGGEPGVDHGTTEALPASISSPALKRVRFSQEVLHRGSTYPLLSTEEEEKPKESSVLLRTEILLYRPNSTFAVRWRVISLIFQTLQLVKLVVTPILLRRWNKSNLAEAFEAAILPVTTAAGCLPSDVKGIDTGSSWPLTHLHLHLFSDSSAELLQCQSLSHWDHARIAALAWFTFRFDYFAAFVGFLDVGLTFHEGVFDEEQGVLRPRPFFQRWIAPGVFSQLLLNPAMKTPGEGLKWLLSVILDVGPDRCLMWFLALLPFLKPCYSRFLLLMQED